jgi:hypothetical protein
MIHPASAKLLMADNAEERLLKARVSNSRVRSCSLAQLPKTKSLTLGREMWPVHRAPGLSGDAVLMLISTNVSCPPNGQAPAGGPNGVIGAQLLPISYVGAGTGTPSVSLTSTLDLLEVLPALPPALCSSLLDLESNLHLEIAILVGEEGGGSLLAEHSPEALLAHLGLGSAGPHARRPTCSNTSRYDDESTDHRLAFPRPVYIARFQSTCCAYCE